MCRKAERITAGRYVITQAKSIRWIYMIAPITYTCRIVYRAHIIPRSDSHRESFYNMARL